MGVNDFWETWIFPKKGILENITIFSQEKPMFLKAQKKTKTLEFEPKTVALSNKQLQLVEYFQTYSRIFFFKSNFMSLLFVKSCQDLKEIILHLDDKS